MFRNIPLENATVATVMFRRNITVFSMDSETYGIRTKGLESNTLRHLALKPAPLLRIRRAVICNRKSAV